MSESLRIYFISCLQWRSALPAKMYERRRNQVALSGGVFQNRLLLELVEKELLNRKFQVLRHHLIPPNDGGIGLGQAVYGMAYLNKKKQTDSKNVK